MATEEDAIVPGIKAFPAAWNKVDAKLTASFSPRMEGGAWARWATGGKAGRK